MPKDLYRKNRIGSVSPLFIPLSLAALLQLLSYPLLSLLPSHVIDMVTSSIPNAQYYLKTAYIATTTTFTTLLALIFFSGSARQASNFQKRAITQQTQNKYVLVVRLFTLISIFIFLVSLYQTGLKIPIIQAINLNPFEYKIYRKEIESTVSLAALNLSLYLFIPTSTIIAFFIARKNKLQLKLLTLIQLTLTLSFFLAKSKVAIPLIIATIAVTLLKPVRLKSLIIPTIAGISLLMLMAIFSAKGTTGITDSTAARIIHGQWLGLPLHIWYYEDKKASPVSYANPSILKLLGIERGTTPGRELMEYLSPQGVEDGTVGNIPTYYVGEAFALAGWPAVFASTLYIYIYVHLATWSFLQIRKTVFTCVLYAIFLYKISYGLTSGLSSFLISSTTLGLFTILLVALAANAKRNTLKSKPCIPTSL